MAFSETTKQQALSRSGYQCECRRIACTEHTTVRCQTKLATGRWHAHHITAESSGGSDAL